MDDWLTIFRTGMWKVYFKLTAEGRKRYFGEFMEKLHSTKYVPFPMAARFWHLTLALPEERFSPTLRESIGFLEHPADKRLFRYYRVNALGEQDKDAW